MADLVERTIYRRAVEAAIWGMPIVSVDAMRQAFLRDAGGSYNDITYLRNRQTGDSRSPHRTPHPGTSTFQSP
jgi:hypothetical protein